MKELIIMLICTAVSIIATFLFGGFRIGFIFVDEIIKNKAKLKLSFCRLIWAVIAINSLALIIGCSFEANNLSLNYGGFGGFFPVLTALSVLSLILCIVFFFVGGKKSLRQYLFSGLRIAPYIAFTYTILICGLILPNVKFALRFGIVICLAVLSCIYLFIRCFALGRLRFTAIPNVFMGEDEYTIVFATSVPTVAYIKYNYNGQEKILWDSELGLKNVGKLHSVRVMKNELENNSYSVHVKRAVEKLPYGGLQGKKEISYFVDLFSSQNEDEIKLLTVADWHGAAKNWDKLPCECTALLLLGDISQSLDSEEVLVHDLLVPCSKVLYGKRPVIFVKGNHDIRGFNITDLYRRLGFPSCYYRFKLGDTNFIALDSGEDKADSNYEYAGYLDCEAYCKEQLNKLLQKSVMQGKNIALAHNPNIFYDKKDSLTALEYLKKNGCTLLIAGHTHVTGFISASEDKYLNINTFVAGSPHEKTPSYSVISVKNSFVLLKTYHFITHEEIFSKELTL